MKSYYEGSKAEGLIQLRIKTHVLKKIERKPKKNIFLKYLTRHIACACIDLVSVIVTRMTKSKGEKGAENEEKNGKKEDVLVEPELVYFF